MAAVAGGRVTAGAGANLIGIHSQARNQEATVYVGNLDGKVVEEVMWELFIQAGPVVNVYMPKDRVTNQHQGYGFVEYKTEDDADYAIKVLNMIKMYGKPIRVNKASADKQTINIGANLFIGNLDPDVDEKLLYDTFSAFGVVITAPKIKRDENTGTSKGFGFVAFDSFEASDAAIEAMNGQMLMNRQINVTYAYKQGSRTERHGTPAERLLAAQMRASQSQQSRPHTMFATGPKQAPEIVTTAQPMINNPVSGFAAGAAPPPPPPPGAYGGGAPPPPPQAAPPPPGAYGGGPPPPPQAAPPQAAYGGGPPAYGGYGGGVPAGMPPPPPPAYGAYGGGVPAGMPPQPPPAVYGMMAPRPGMMMPPPPPGFGMRPPMMGGPPGAPPGPPPGPPGPPSGPPGPPL